MLQCCVYSVYKNSSVYVCHIFKNTVKGKVVQFCLCSWWLIHGVHKLVAHLTFHCVKTALALSFVQHLHFLYVH